LLSPVFGIILGIILIGLYLTIGNYIDLIYLCCGEEAPIFKCFVETVKDILCCKCNCLELIKREDCCIVIKKICLYFISIILFVFYFLIYIWIDLCIFFKGKKRNKIYKNVFGRDIQIEHIWESNLSRKEPDIYKDKEKLKKILLVKIADLFLKILKHAFNKIEKLLLKIMMIILLKTN
jgi:hypothetical protein